MKHLSIKARVMILCTLLAALIAGLALTAMLYNEQRVVEGYFRDSLAATAQLAQNNIRAGEQGLEIDRNLDDLPSVRVAVYTLDGDLIYGQHRFELPFEAETVRETGGSGGVQWMVQDTRLQPEGASAVWLRCYMSADAMENVRGIRREVLVVMVPVLILLAELGGWLIARRAFHPIRRIIRTAEGIVDGDDLKKRIALDGTRDEIYQVAQVFDAMLDRLDAAFERERRFTSDASHELRTPVAAILAQSEFARSDDAGEGDMREALAEIHRQGGHMSTLIQSLLNLSRLDQRRTLPDREEIDLGMLAELTAESLQGQAAQRGISLAAGSRGSAVVHGDQTMLMQAVCNLAENAIKYGKNGGSVRIEACGEGGLCRLRVQDDGPGIAPEHLERIFDRFYQVDASRSDRGFGLGLSLVKRIVQLHGGRVEVHSVPGEGSCFEMIFEEVNADG